ncbi:MAG: 2-succinyl-6-hydroxy-2,4-cyclohexadiene-1-carboxylate synthase [Nostocales cyanobacterium]|nr:MAG: 2-succinyl-6-hydroxy-2,4-cyclohexadiene-1-carboxylate synthase [Nostocales cyanobacterium]TAF09275.1 MAG: 2-succinyl-6-hydroxy-2,4-cyclohexadiene-1-carboxylate synthase [Nostocales cyanobacterium]
MNLSKVKLSPIYQPYNFHYSLVKNPGKPVILFLHGFMGKIDEFDDAIKLLGDNFSYLTLDLPGHGKTKVLAGDEYYKIENTAQGIINLLDELEIQECYLVGYSMGGRLGVYLTLHFPERFIKAVIESASPGLRNNTERLARIKKDYQIARKLIGIIDESEFKDFLDYWYNQEIFGNLKNHPNYYNMLHSRLENDPLHLGKSLQFLGTGYQPSLWDKFRENRVPLMLLVGEYDEKFIQINKLMRCMTTSARMEIISKAGHNTHLENTLAFVQYLNAFFE